MVRVMNSSDYKIVNRIVNGKKFQSTRPTTYQQTKNPDCIKHHAKFGLAARLAKYLRQFKLPYQCWKEAKLEGTRGYNRIISYNYKKVTPFGPTESVMITPPGFKPPFKEFTSSEGFIRLDFVDGYKVNPDTDYIIVIMILYEPNGKVKVPYKFRWVHYNHLLDSKQFSFALNRFHDKTFNKFIIYSAVMRYSKKKLRWSSTYAFSGNF